MTWRSKRTGTRYDWVGFDAPNTRGQVKVYPMAGEPYWVKPEGIESAPTDPYEED